jgi:hypothetical protein
MPTSIIKLVLIQRYAVSWQGSEYEIILFEKYRSTTARKGNDWETRLIYELQVEVEVEVEVNLRPTVSRPVWLGVRHPSETRDQFFFLLEIYFRQLRVYYLALPEQSLLGRSPAELTAIFYCLIWDSPNLEDQVPVFFIPQEQGGPVIPPGTGFLFCRRATI